MLSKEEYSLGMNVDNVVHLVKVGLFLVPLLILIRFVGHYIDCNQDATRVLREYSKLSNEYFYNGALDVEDDRVFGYYVYTVMSDRFAVALAFGFDTFEPCVELNTIDDVKEVINMFEDELNITERRSYMDAVYGCILLDCYMSSGNEQLRNDLKLVIELTDKYTGFNKVSYIYFIDTYISYLVGLFIVTYALVLLVSWISLLISVWRYTKR